MSGYNNGFRGRPKGCFVCNETNHFARDCPKKAERSKGCYRCGSEDHRVMECPSETKGVPNITCYHCEERGHYAKDCPNKSFERSPRGGNERGGGGGGGGYDREERGGRRDDRRGGGGGGYSSDRDRCFTCHKSGHFKAECPMRDTKHQLCYHCGSGEHLMSECPSDEKDFKFAECFFCSKNGHFSTDCPEKTSGNFAEGEEGGEDGEGNNFYKNSLKKRMDQGTTLLPKKTEDKIYRQKRAMRAKDMPEEEIRGQVNDFRRTEEGKYKRFVEKKCFRCREPGHFVDQCPQQEDKTDVCYRCGSSDHRVIACPSTSKTLDFLECYHCKETGHIAKKCPQQVNANADSEGL